MDNTNFGEKPEAIEFAEHDNTDWVNYLPEDTLRERIVKRALVQNMIYGLKTIYILTGEVVKDDTDSSFVNVTNSLKLFSLSVAEPGMHRASIIRVFKDACSKPGGVARIDITDEYDAVKTRLHLSDDERRLVFYEGEQLSNKYPADGIKRVFYDIQKKPRISDDIYKFLEVWRSIMKQMGRYIIVEWEIDKVVFLDCDESFDKYDIRFNIFVREDVYMELHILKRNKFWLVAGRSWDYVYRECELDGNLNIAIKELVIEYHIRNFGGNILRLIENPEKYKGELVDMSHCVFDLDDNQIEILYDMVYEQSIANSGTSIKNNWCDDYKSILMELNGNANSLFDELLPMFDTEENFRERWGVEDVFCTRKLSNDSGILQFEPAFTFVVRGCLFDGFISITASAPQKYTIHLFDRAQVFLSKWECDTTKCRLESMLDIIIDCGYLGADVRKLADAEFVKTMYSIKYFRSAGAIND